jgi:hypothetical protein
MGRLKLTLDGIALSYLPAGVPAPADEFIGNFDELEDRLLARHPRMRRVTMRLLPSLPVMYYLLHFSDGSDLHRLDEKVAAGRAVDADFQGALLGEALSIVCPHCAAILRAVVVDTGHPLFARDRARRLREHDFHRECPVCGGHLTAYVLEFIDSPPAGGSR